MPCADGYAHVVEQYTRVVMMYPVQKEGKNAAFVLRLSENSHISEFFQFRSCVFEKGMFISRHGFYSHAFDIVQSLCKGCASDKVGRPGLKLERAFVIYGFLKGYRRNPFSPALVRSCPL